MLTSRESITFKCSCIRIPVKCVQLAVTHEYNGLSLLSVFIKFIRYSVYLNDQSTKRNLTSKNWDCHQPSFGYTLDLVNTLRYQGIQVFHATLVYSWILKSLLVCFIGVVYI